MTPEQRRARGERAQRLIEDELFQEVITHVRDELLKEWEVTKPEEQERREDAHRQIRLLKKLLAGFQRIASDGKVAANDLMLDETRHRGPRRVA